MSFVAPPQARSGLNPIVREVARGGLAGLIVGVLVGGIGGRVAMRTSALIDPAASGFTTEAGATVNEFTLEGTVGFVVFVGLFVGIALGVIWVVAQRWLPGRGVARYSAAAALGVAMGGRFGIEGRNIDFLILDPKPAQIGIFVVLSALGGVSVAAVDRWLEYRLPSADGSARHWYRVVALLGVLLALPVTAGMFAEEACSCASAPRLPGVMLVLLGAIVIRVWVSEARNTQPSSRLLLMGRVLLFALVLTGLVHLGGEIAHFT